MKNTILQPTELASDEQIEITLRPSTLPEFVGQPETKEMLLLALRAANQRKEPLDHVLLYGPPGLGKTTLAHIIAHELKGNLHLTAGPAITRAGDLASLLMNLESNDVIFIDEIHRINRAVEETLYSAMEEGRLDIILGKGPAARSVRIDLKPFTLVGATTKYGALTSPLRSRFGFVQKLNFYSPPEIQQILERSAKILKVEISQDAIISLATRSRGIPRIANRLLRRARDMAEVKFNNRITSESLLAIYKLLKIDELGLDQADREVLRLIITHHHGGPVGLSTIANTLSEDEETILDVYEPFLMASGLLARTKQGRVVTDKAYTHLGLSKK